jgi:hypothetical protein
MRQGPPPPVRRPHHALTAIPAARALQRMPGKPVPTDTLVSGGLQLAAAYLVVKWEPRACDPQHSNLYR